MKIQISNELTYDGKNLRPGDIVNIEDDNVAKGFIDGGYAIEAARNAKVTVTEEDSEQSEDNETSNKAE